MPTSLKMQGYWMATPKGKKVIYPCERTEEFKKKYPTLKVYVGGHDDVATTRMDGNHQKALFPLHQSVAHQGLASIAEKKDTDGDAQGFNSCMRMGLHVTSHEDLLKRVEFLKGKASGRKVKTGERKSLADMFDDDEQEEYEDEDEDCSMIDPDNEPESTAAPSQSNEASSIKRSGSSTSLVPEQKKKKTKDNNSQSAATVNPHTVGTAEYWIHELNFELAFDGDNLGHALSQGGLLAPKLEQSQRDPLNSRMVLARQAKTLSYNVVADVCDKDILHYIFHFSETICDVFGLCCYVCSFRFCATFCLRYYNARS